MKNILKALAAVLIVLSFVTTYPGFAAAAYTPAKIKWLPENDYSLLTDTEIEYKGELREGANDVTLNDGVYSFKASKTGYYAFSGDFFGFYYSKSSAGNTVFKEGDLGFFAGPDNSMYSDSEEIVPVYLNKGEKVFYRFYTVPDDRDAKEYTYAVRDGKVKVKYLGEVACASLKDNTFYSENGDIYFYPDDTSYIDLHTPVEYRFTEGGRYKSDYITCELDNINSGEHKIKAELFEDHGFEITIRIVDLEEMIKEVRLPAGFVPKADVYYDCYGFRFCNETYPDSITFILKDGTKKKIYKSGEDSFHYTLTLGDGSRHIVFVWYTLNDNGTITLDLKTQNYRTALLPDCKTFCSFEAEVNFINPPENSTLCFLRNLSQIAFSSYDITSGTGPCRAACNRAKALERTVKEYISYCIAEQNA